MGLGAVALGHLLGSNAAVVPSETKIANPDRGLNVLENLVFHAINHHAHLLCD